VEISSSPLAFAKVDDIVPGISYFLCHCVSLSYCTMLFLKVVAGVILSNLHGSINSHLSLFVKRGEAGMSSLSKPFKYMREKQEIKAWDVQPIQAFQIHERKTRNKGLGCPAYPSLSTMQILVCFIFYFTIFFLSFVLSGDPNSNSLRDWLSTGPCWKKCTH